MKEANNLGEAFKKKTTSFLFLGILLMIASMYMNSLNLKDHAGDIGIFYSEIIIMIAIGMQIILWIIHLIREKRILFPKKENNTKII